MSSSFRLKLIDEGCIQTVWLLVIVLSSDFEASNARTLGYNPATRAALTIKGFEELASSSAGIATSLDLARLHRALQNYQHPPRIMYIL